MLHLTRAAVLVTTLAGCGGAQSEAAEVHSATGPLVAATVPGAAAAAPEVPTGSRHVALRYELNGRKFPLPLVRGTVAGQAVWMLVDTGANSHVIASWVARKAGLHMRALGEVGSDHTGRAVAAYVVEHPNLAIEQWGPLPDRPMLVTDVPAPIARLGIGGFISPQWLADADEALVLDLANHEIRSASWEEASRALDAQTGRELAPGGARLCRDDASAIKGLAFILRASVDGYGVDLLLDTGAHRTDLLTTSQAGRQLFARATPNREQTYTAAGLVKTSLVRAADIRIGDWSLTSDIDLVPGVSDPHCPRDGVIAIDALQSCTLLLGRERVRGRCGP